MRRTLVLSCALVLLAGCGGKPWSEATSSSNPSARLLAAVTRTTDAHTADFSLTVKVTSSATAATVNLSGAGKIDFSQRNADMKFDASALGKHEQLEMREIAGKIYMNEGGEWSVADSPSAAQDGSLNGSTDPTQYLQYVRGVSSDVHVVGRGTVDGVHVTTYAGTIDLHNLFASSSLSADQRQQLQSALDALGSGLRSMPFIAALDDQGRLRMLNMTMDLSVAGESAHMDMTIKYSNFGVAVSITPPPGFANDSPTTVESPSGPDPAQTRAQDRAAQSDLRNGLTAEKVEYTDNEKYSSDVDEMASIEGSLDWGGALHVAVTSDKQTVCLWEKSKSGAAFAIADVAAGPYAGTYFGTTSCPPSLTPASVSRHTFNTGW